MVQTTDSQIPEEVLLPNRGAYDPDVEAEEALRGTYKRIKKHFDESKHAKKPTSESLWFR